MGDENAEFRVLPSSDRRMREGWLFQLLRLKNVSTSWANEYRDRASRGEAFGRDADQVRMTWEAWHGRGQTQAGSP